MLLDDVLNLYSGDHGGRMGDFPYANGGCYAWSWTRYDYEKVDVIAASMEKHGWQGPPVCVMDGILHNGHHRTIAAYLVGLVDIPTTASWSESEGDDWFSEREGAFVAYSEVKPVPLPA